MKVYGLTGGVGMGKSTSDAWLRERGWPVIDTDLIARELVEPGEPALAEIKKVFGDQFIAPDGTLRRAELARRVFADKSARQQLEEILHPRIRESWQKKLETLRAEKKAACAVVDIPLLFETGAQGQFDRIICVACLPATQAKRLRARGWEEPHIRQRVDAQWPIQKKIELSDYVVWTEGSLDAHQEQLQKIFAWLD